MKPIVTWKIEAQGDTVYTQGRDVHDAYCNFVKAIGQMDFEALQFSVIDSLPEDEVYI